ncbi:antitoxin Xre/MbcA/ParS toxin-binding domain-containing protein [Geopseudomonas aromaticivorans]
MAEDSNTTPHVVAVQALAERVFEDRQVALDWMARPNQALAGATPLSCCATEVGAQQARRILRAIEFGGVA